MHNSYQQQYLSKYLGPANEIITKKVENQTKSKIVIDKGNTIINPAQDKFKHQQQQENLTSEQDDTCDRLTIANGYSKKSMIYKKVDNSDFMERNNKKYFASIFTNLSDWPSEIPYSLEQSQIRFSSTEQSMNLFAAFQTGPAQYDLILQNDINTCGYTQWFYFSVFNKSKNQTIKINIVNLYKSKSLYSSGMKPLTFSKKSNKGWQRAATSICYSQNQLNVQYSKKFYKTLSFEYTFLQENNQTHFAHCFPYKYSYLKQKLKLFQKNSKIKIKFIGSSCMKRPIPLVEFSQQDSNPIKKAIIVMARQHPGETVGSLIMDQFMSELSKATTQNQFLLWRFNIYCIPMVNVDGVVLGNYRGNAYGFDLNRCWDRQNSAKLPQIFYIKKEIKKIMKKFPVQLILDLHGHSRKMGSFFYGNPFGKHTGLFAYISSKMSQNISFQNSTFQKQKSQKVTTARVVLGNLIKDTGSFYTYQTSFYGAMINNKKTHFNLQNYQQLGRTLINSIYKTFMEIQKQQKTLKQSLFLRQIRKQLIIARKEIQNSASGSDSEAQQMTIKQMSIKLQLRNDTDKNCLNNDIQNSNKKQFRQKKSVQIQVGQGQLQYLDSFPASYSHIANQQVDFKKIIKIQQIKKQNKKLIKLGRASQKNSIYIGFQKSQQLTNSRIQSFQNKQSNDSLTRKHFLMQKLRVFGETFIEKNQKQVSKQTQTGMLPLSIQNLSKKVVVQQQIQQPSTFKSTQYRRRKSRNKSLIIRIDNKDKLAMADIVRVNRLEYRKIKRDSLVEIKKKQVITILPNIIN